MFRCPNCHAPLYKLFEVCRQCDNKIDPSLPNEKDISDRYQSSPRFASFAEFTNSKAKSNKKYLLVASLVALLLFVREGGFVNLTLFNFNAKSKTQTSLNGNEHTELGEAYAETRKDLDSVSTTKNSYFRLGLLPLSDDSPLIVDLKEEIQDKLNKQTQFIASVEEVALTGLYWLPFVKSGSCKYRVRLQFIGKDSIVYTGVLNGVTDFDTSGLCSVRTFKQTVTDEVAAGVVKSVENDVWK
jgi:rRNA maturation protein Nop10